MLFKGSMSSMRDPERLSASDGPSLLERELPPTPNPTSPVPSFSDFQDGYVPPWMRDTASTTSTTRQSRASSIISTLTRFTTTSVDDARSIDIQVGGQNFRIARDASKITSEAPPPYTADEAITRSYVLEEVRPRTAPINTPPSDSGSDGPRRLPEITTLGANILNPSEVDIPSPIGDDNTTPPVTPRGSSRTRETNGFEGETSARYHSGYNGGVDVRETLTRSLTVRPYKPPGTRDRADLPLLSTSPVELRMLGKRPISTQSKSWQTMSAEDLLLAHPEDRSQEPQSPDYIGRHADGIFPPDTASQLRLRSDSGYSGEIDPQEEASRTPGMDSENEISLHYAGMLRFVDKQHRRALHLRDKEMEELRIRMSNMDTVYRQQLRGRDFIVEDLKRRLGHIEDMMEAKLERARNEVEDVWERRWKDRDFHLRERMSRIESQAGLDPHRSRNFLPGQDDDV
jgi:hypothetical protein